MKKRLLFSLVALMVAMGTFAAAKAGDYVYTTSARLKLTGDDLLAGKGTFSDGTTGDWVATTDCEAGLSDFIDVASDETIGANAATFKATSATDGMYLVAEEITEGKYVVTFDMKAGEAFTSVTTVDASNAIWAINNDTGDDQSDDISVKSTDVFTVGTTWQTYSIVLDVTNPDNGFISIVFNGLPLNTQIANVQIFSATEVYDVRLLNNKLSWAKTYMDDENFNQNTSALEALTKTYNTTQGYINNNMAMFDDISSGQGVTTNLNKAIETYLEASAGLINDQFNLRQSKYSAFRGTLDFTLYANCGRGRLTCDASSTEGNVVVSGNWQKRSNVSANTDGSASNDGAYVESTIQNSYAHTATITFNQPNWGPGKYFVTGEIRNAYTGKSSTYTYDWTATSNTILWIGKDASGAYSNTKECTISGSDFQKFYFVADIPEGSTFSAGFDWPGIGAKGGSFQIQNVQIRCFGAAEQKAAADRKANYWDPFVAQVNAAQKSYNLIADSLQKHPEMYPYAQDSLATAVQKWYPYLQDLETKGYVVKNVSETGAVSFSDPGASKVSNEYLSWWKTYQGGIELNDTVYKTYNVNIFDASLPSDSVRSSYFVTSTLVNGEVAATSKFASTYNYQVVRGLQYAQAYAINKIAHFTTLKATITAANLKTVDPRMTVGELTTFKQAIADAQNVYDTKYASASDASWKEDSTAVMDANTTLLNAITVFEASVEANLKPIVDIDFSKSYISVQAKDEEGNPSTDEETGAPIIDHYEAVGNICENGIATNMSFVNFTPDNSYTYPVEGGLGSTYTNSTSGVTTYSGYTFGSGESNMEVLRVGYGNGIVVLPELADTVNGVLDVQFDMYFGNLTGKYAGVDLQDANGTRIAGFNIGKYSGSVGYNDFNDAANTGFDALSWVSSLGNSATGDNALCVATNLSVIRLVIDYKAGKVKAYITNGANGSHEGAWIDINSALTYTSVAKVVLHSDYVSATARNCWFDNLKIYKYNSIAEGKKTVKGDVNGDGSVNISDVNAVISVMCGDTTYAASADVNGDGAVNISDVNAVITIMCGGSL